MRKVCLFTIGQILIMQLLFAQNDINELERLITTKDYKKSRPIALQLVESEIDQSQAFGYWALGVGMLSNNPDSANIFLEKALAKNRDEDLLLKILNAQANYYDIVGQTRKSVNLFLELVNLSKNKNPGFLASAFNNLCIGYRSLDLFDSSIHYGFLGLEEAERQGQQYEQKRLLNSIAITYAVQGDLKTAGSYFKKSLNHALHHSDSTGAAKSFINLTQLKIYQEELDSAEYYLNQAISWSQNRRNVRDVVDMYSLLAEVVLDRGETNEGLVYLDQALMHLQGLNFLSVEMAITLTKAEALLELGEISRAQEALDRVFDLVKIQDGVGGLLEANRLQSELFIQTGRPWEALELQKAIDSLREVKYAGEKIKAMEDVRIKYETEKKEQQIIQLNQEREIADFKARRQQWIFFAVLAGFIVIIIFGVAFYRNRTLKLAKQRLLVEQKLLRSQMNPHFLFNALSSIHSFIFQGNKLEAAEYLTTFSELTRDILEHSERDWISLEKEIVTLKKYIEIQQIRFPDISYQLQIDEDLDVTFLLVPPMLLQPFVENAFEHGLKDKKGGRIEIDIYEKANYLIISIQDNGNGMQQSNASHQSKAIEITNERLGLLYNKGDYKLSIENRTDSSGVLVSIDLPKVEAI